MTNRSDSELAGQTLAGGRYVLSEVVGSGAFGVVYRARHVALDKDVAVKILFREVAEKHSVVAERFKREAQGASQLQHANIVQMLDFGEEDGRLFLVMEYLEGRNLLEELNHRQHITLADIVEIMAQVCAGLAAAHDLDMVHRDMKPENVVLLRATRDDGSDGVLCKVLDFGIAKIRVRDSGDSQPSLTGKGEIFGTPEYMSPEQARGSALDARSDIYSLGIMLYQMVCGHTPFESSETPVGLLMRHLTELPKPPSELVPDVAPELEAVILKALAKEPEDRFQTVRELRAALLGLRSEWNSGERTNAYGLSETLPSLNTASGPRLTTQLPPRRLGLGLALGVALVLVVVFVFQLASSNVPEPAKESPVQPGDPVAAVPVDTRPDSAAAIPAEVLPPKLSEQSRSETLPVAKVVRALAVAVAANAFGAQPRLFERAEPGEALVATTAVEDGGRPRRGRRKTNEPEVNSIDPSEALQPEAPAEVAVEKPVEVQLLDVEAVTVAIEEPPTVEKIIKVEKTPLPAPSLEADVKLSRVKVSGSLSQNVVERAVESEVEAFESCYRKAAQKAGRDEALSLDVGFVIDVDGWVEKVQTKSSSLDGLTTCVKDVVGKMRMRERPDTGVVAVGLKLVFTPH